MQFSFVAALAAFAGLASAQKVQVVTVSTKNNSLVYSPSNIKAAVGDMVQFQFVAGNHTVTQSTFDQPCQPINMFTPNVTGFHSGYQPVAAGGSNIPTYTIQVKNTTPMWVYCAQGKHCQAGMVMVINENTAANASRSLAAFKKLATTATTISPGAAAAGGSAGTGSASTTGGTAGTGTGSAAGTGSTTPGTTTAGAGMVRVGGSLGLAGLVAAVMLL